MSDRIFLKCRLSRGAFSGEKIYCLQLANGSVLTSIVSRSHCSDANGNPIDADGPPEEIDALIEGILLRGINTQWLVNVPDHMESKHVWVRDGNVIWTAQKTGDVTQAKRQRSDNTSLRTLADAVRRLIASLPKCSYCTRVATHAWVRGAARFCDDCVGPGCPEYPRAQPLRETIAALEALGRSSQ